MPIIIGLNIITNMLTEHMRNQLDGIVHKMVQNGEPDGAIRFVVDDFKNKYDQGVSGASENSPGYFSRLGQNYKNALNEYTTGIKESAETVNKGGAVNINKGLFRGMLRPLGTTVRTVFAPISEAISPLINKAVEVAGENKVIQKIANNKSVSSFLDHIDNWQKKNPAMAQDVKDIFDVVSSVAGEKPANKAGEVVGKSAAETAKVPGKTMSMVGKKIYKSADPFIPNTQEAKMTQSFRAKTSLGDRLKASYNDTKLLNQPTTMGDTALKYNLFGSKSGIGTQAKTAMNTIWNNNIKPALENVKGLISKDDVFKNIQSNINKITNKTRQKILQESFNSIKEDYAKVKFWKHLDAQNLKSDLAKRLPEKTYLGKPTGAVNEVNNMFASELRSRIRQSLPDNIAALYDDYGNLSVISDRGAKALTQPEKLGGSGKLIWGTVSKATTPIKTTGGLIMNKIGNKLK